MDHAAYIRRVSSFFAHEYVDRGMLKWQGFFLSDHTAALKRQAAAEQAAPTDLPAQSQALIRAALARAFATGQSVRAQPTGLTPDGTHLPPFVGVVGGYTTDDGVRIGTQTVTITELRHVAVLPFKK
ncbi:phage infection protein [Lacticaseibacillus absianus]|uniref:phage infection protein n=1 Tax=Lacticaseibacillus absianus TaxID=2729623 RepID=UPI0015CBD500|nr:phage infection protein [Lacticaseibacillus absianus]